MPTRKIKSLHFNLATQDAYTGGPNVIYHRSHRAKSGRRTYKTTKNREIIDHLRAKMEKYDEFEEKSCKILDY